MKVRNSPSNVRTGIKKEIQVFVGVQSTTKQPNLCILWDRKALSGKAGLLQGHTGKNTSELRRINRVIHACHSFGRITEACDIVAHSLRIRKPPVNPAYRASLEPFGKTLRITLSISTMSPKRNSFQVQP